MAWRLKIPFVLDLAVVRDDAEMTRLNNEPGVVREVTGKRGLVHRLIRSKIETLRVDTGRLLPALEKRSNGARRTAQDKAERDLSLLADQKQPFERQHIARLARFVASDDLEQPVGITVQELIGRFRDARYTATEESYAAARDVAAVFSACPVTALRVMWWKLTGRLAASKTLIWDKAAGDPIQIHATAIAMHHVVDSLERMRTAMRTDVWDTPAAQAARCALAAPPRLIRECTARLDGRDDLRDGTMIWFNLRAIHQDTESNPLAFSEAEWSQCPAHKIVPRLLEEVWTTAVSERRTQRYRPRPSRLHRLAIRAATWVNRRRPWYRLGSWLLAFGNLAILRLQLREQNLHDTSLLPTAPGRTLPPPTPDVLRWRTADGSYNDLNDPTMGQAGTRFGRNVPLAHTYPDEKNLLEPSPREVSRHLLARGETIQTADHLNVLAAAWIQFQVHDWFNHANDEQRSIDIPLKDDDPWRETMAALRVPRTLADPTRPDRTGPPTYLNRVTHWWDASQLYGSDEVRQDRVRSHVDGKHVDGKLALVTPPKGEPRLPRAGDEDSNFVPGVEITGFNDNWWLGLSLFHQLFTLEHNAICDRLKAEFPDWGDEQLFQTARLVNAALMTKIHDLEWVPIILANRPVQYGLKVSWWGMLGKWIATHIGRLPDSEMLSGIPGSATDHHAAPYAITEEFVSVYRMHAFMMPDLFDVYTLADGRKVDTRDLKKIIGSGAGKTVDEFRFAHLFYSFGRNAPGALTLGNYSTTLRQLVLEAPPLQPGGPPRKLPPLDLATIDILRDRERGVPRYNEFRRLLHLPPVTSFTDLNPAWADRLRKVYNANDPHGPDRVDLLDLLVGMFAETPPPGFAFSDTTFRIFLLMNSRRMKSDRFYTTDFTPAVYTQAGLDWVTDNTLRSVLLRHYPALEPALRGVKNVFGPWNALGGGGVKPGTPAAR